MYEDKNINGMVDAGESDPLVPDFDNDTVLDCDGLDNCLLKSNEPQRDIDHDGIENSCDPDFNNNCIVDAGDFTFLKSRIFTQNPDADLNGNGIVDAADFSQLKFLFLNYRGRQVKAHAVNKHVVCYRLTNDDDGMRGN